MADYKHIFKSEETQNWIKCGLAINIARDGLVNFVKEKIDNLHQRIFKTVIKDKNLPVDTICAGCSTFNVTICPTKDVCRLQHGKCSYHTSQDKFPKTCPNQLCNNVKTLLQQEHRFNNLSLKNTNAAKWGTSSWELAKCFMPRDGYTDVLSAEETDFNGLISIIINCKEFQQSFTDDLSKTKNICTEARDAGRSVRHTAGLSFSDEVTNSHIETLCNMFTNFKHVSDAPKAAETQQKLRELNADRLTITTTDVAEVLNKTVNSAKEELCVFLEDTKKQLATWTCSCSSLDDITHYENLKDELRRDLICFCQERQSSVPLSPLMPEIDDDVSKCYVPLTMTETKSKKEVKTYEGIFRKDSRQAKNIYIQGAPGMGKSTFCTKLTSLWSKAGVCRGVVNKLTTKKEHERVGDMFTDTSIVNDFRFVFSIALRSVRRDQCDIENMIEDQIISELPNNEKYKGLVPMILAKERCLIVLDGLDEWSHNNSSCRKSESIPHRKTWANTTVLTSSRPWKIHEVRLKDSQVDTCIEITGISDHIELSSKVIECLNKKYKKAAVWEDFMKEINTKNTQQFLEIPIVLLQLICVWHYNRNIGSSKCEIYANMVDMMFRRAHENGSDSTETDPKESNSGHEMPNCFKNTQNCCKNKTFLDSIGRLAFYSLHSSDKASMIVLSSTEVSRYMPTEMCQQALRIGLLSQHKSTSLLSRNSFFCFLHKTFQEFLAAYYMATAMSDTESIMQVLARKNEDITSISELFIFACGMNLTLALKMSCLINAQLTTKITEMHCRHTLYDLCSYSAHTHSYIFSLHRLIAKGYNEAKLNGYFGISLRLDHLSLRLQTVADNEKTEKLIEMNKGNIVTLCAIGISVSVSEINEIAEESTNTLENVVFNGWYPLNDICLDLSKCREIAYFSAINVSTVEQIKLNTTSLMYCRLWNVSTNFEQSVLNAVSKSKILKRISVKNMKNPEQFCEILPTLPNLQHVHLELSVFEEDHYLQVPPLVTSISLVHVTMSSVVFRKLVNSLAQMPHKVTIYLRFPCIKPFEDIHKIFSKIGGVQLTNKLDKYESFQI